MQCNYNDSKKNIEDADLQLAIQRMSINVSHTWDESPWAYLNWALSRWIVSLQVSVYRKLTYCCIGIHIWKQVLFVKIFKIFLWVKGSLISSVGLLILDGAISRYDRKSTFGYCTFVGGNLVTWRSKKHVEAR